ncbi:MAG TPA: hypothetical protein VFF68_00980, partial [Anaerolineaceae bacterium]|nr:hypothetical protein [Anaerolineaceae bacterium]
MQTIAVPTAQSPRSFFPRLQAALRTACRHFPAALRRYPLLTAFLAGYALLRFGVNAWHFSARPGTALISALMGLVMHGLAVLLIDTVHVWRFGDLTDPSVAGTGWQEGPHKRLLVGLGLFWLLWLAVIVDHNQRLGSVPGAPVLGFVPGWAALDALTFTAAERMRPLLAGVEAGALHGYVKAALLTGLLLAGMRLAGWRGRDLSLTFRGGWVAAPLLAITGLAFAF